MCGSSSGAIPVRRRKCARYRGAPLWSAIIRVVGTSASDTCKRERLWHDEHMLQLARAIVGVVSDVLRLVVSFLRSSSAIRAENLVLRKQLASTIERRIKPRRMDHVTGVSLALFTRLFDWRDTVVNVRPATIVRWHRMGWRIIWRWKCRAGRPPIPPELRRLIRRMAVENPLWGEERIANELLLKLGIRVSPRTVRK
jgi:putative transposase